MAPKMATAEDAWRKAERKLKTVARLLERQLPPLDNMDEDDTVASEPAFRSRPRTSSIASCAACLAELDALEVGAREGHVCSHQQDETGVRADDEVSLAGSDIGQQRDTSKRGGGKKKQPDPGS